MSNIAPLKAGKPTARELLAGVKVIDVDTHFSEPWDLWTSRAPASLKHRVPRTVRKDGKVQWIIDEDTPVGFGGAGGSSAILRDGSKLGGFEFFNLTIEDIHLGASVGKARVEVMDQQGIHAQIVYPNLLGFGGQVGKGVDPALRLASVKIFNDAMAEMQAESNDRILPMILLPWWDVKESIAELERGVRMGMKGVNMTSDTQDMENLPPLSHPHYDDLFKACVQHNLSVNFHIGGSDSGNAWFAQGRWPGLTNNENLAMGGALLLSSNMRVIGNIIMSHMLDRHPGLKIVSVESGVGWIPYLLEALDYLSIEQRVEHARPIADTFRAHIYATTFFERKSLIATVSQIGADNIMFETDFPHPACLYPDWMDYLGDTIAQLAPEDRFKIFSGNAARVYGVDIGTPSAGL
jgi:predicted TIM-barrel fold metal-dependent hydrolase